MFVNFRLSYLLFAFLFATLLTNKLLSQICLPPDYSHLKLWLRSDTLVTYDLGTGKVSEWGDASGNNNDAIQNISSLQPIREDSILFIYPGVRFDGGDAQVLDVGDIGMSGSFSIITIVSTIDKDANPAQYIMGLSSSPLFAVGSFSGNSNWLVYQGSVILQSTKTIENGKFYMVSFTNDSNNTKGTLFDNTSPAFNNNYSAADIDNITIGKRSDNSWSLKGYLTEVIIYDSVLNDQQLDCLWDYLRYKYAPPVNLGPDIAMPDLCDTTLDAGARFTAFKWNGNLNDTNQTFTFTKPGKYYIDVTDIFGFTSSDTIEIAYPLNQISDSTICLGDTLKWNTNLSNSNYTFQWSDSSADSLLTITQQGQYSVTVSDGTCSLASDTVNVIIDNFLAIVNLGSTDTSICLGNSIGLISGDSLATQYLWSTNDTTPSITIDTPGIYKVTVSDASNCTANDSIDIIIKGNAPLVNFTANDICFGDTSHFSDSSFSVDLSSIITWQWNFGDSFSDSVQYPTHIYNIPGTYIVSLTVETDSGCSNSFSKFISVFNLPQANFSFFDPVCAGSSLSFSDSSQVASDTITSWQWDFGDNNSSSLQTPVHLYSSAGNYSVKLKVNTLNGCIDSMVKTAEVFNCSYPSTINGLQLWFSADNGVIYDSSGKISQWMDLSGNNNTASQGTSILQPTFYCCNEKLNNKPSVKFGKNGNTGNETILTFLPVSLLQDSLTVIFLYKTDSIVNNLHYILGHTSQGISVGGTSYPNCLIFDGSTILQGQPPRMQYEFLSYYGNKIFSNGSVVPTSGSSVGAMTFSSMGARPDGLVNFFYGEIVEGIFYNNALADSDRVKVENYLRYKYAPPVNIGPDISMTNLCEDTLVAESRFTSFRWNGNPNDSNQTYVFSKSGKYYVDAVDIFGFTSSDTVEVTYPFNQIANADTLCLGDTLEWNTGLNQTDYDFQWSTSATDSLIKIAEAGTYTVTVTEYSTSCPFISDTVFIAVDSFPVVVSLGGADSLCSGNSIGLISGGAEAVNYTWSTGDTTPAIVIDSSGNYSVTVQNALGCSSADDINITIVGDAPTVNFSATEVCLGNITQFSDSSTSSDSIISWNWDFGDNVSDTMQDPGHSYSSPGTFTVSLIVQTDAGCSNNKSKTVIVHPLPQAGFFVENQIFCSGDSISFEDNSTTPEGTITSWLWNFDDASSGSNNISSDESPAHFFADSGNYGVSLIIEDSIGCIDTFTDNILIYPKPGAAFYIWPGCKGAPTKFFDNSSGIVTQWDWDFGDENNSNQAYPENIYDTAGEHYVSLIVTTLIGCIDTVSDSVTVYHNPEAYFTTTDFCRGTPIQAIDSSTVINSSVVSWNWNVQGTDLSSTQQHPYFVFNSTSLNQYMMNLKVTSAQGCTDEYSWPINVHNSPVADFSYSTPYGEIPLSVTFINNSDDSAVSYFWDFGNGDTSAQEDPVYIFTDSGEYQVQLTAYTQYGCADGITRKIKIREPVLDIAVTRVRTNSNNQFMTVSADLYNVGNMEITSFEIFAELSNRPAVKESWNGSFGEKSDTVYTFNASFEMPDNTMPDAVCIRVENPNSGNDANPADNEMCISFSDFKILSIYPNPSSKEIFIEYTLTGEADSQEIIIYDKVGKKVKEFRLESGKKGLHRISLDISDLSHGIYALKITYGANHEVKRFMKY